MATLTIRNLPDDLVKRLKTAAAQRGQSMEQEIRDLLQARYIKKSALIDQIRAKWDGSIAPTAREIQRWRKAGRD